MRERKENGPAEPAQSSHRETYEEGGGPERATAGSTAELLGSVEQAGGQSNPGASSLMGFFSLIRVVPSLLFFVRGLVTLFLRALIEEDRISGQL